MPALPPPFRNPLIPGRLMSVALGLSGLAVLVLMQRTGLGIALYTRGFLAMAGAIAVLALLRLMLRRYQSPMRRRLCDFSEHALMFAGTCLLGALASYPAAAETSGFADARLYRLDRDLHFNWLWWYGEVSASPFLQVAGVAAYASIYVTPLILLGWFAWHRQKAEARLFLATFWLAALFTLLLFPLFPAEGPLAFLWRGPIPYMPTSALYQEQLIPVLRHHALRAVDLGALRGLVCAPSFHTAAGLVYMAAAWPVRRLRWIVLPVNVAMLLATPVEGTHYLADMIAGGGVALAAIVVVRALVGVWRPAPAFAVMQRRVAA